MSASVYKRHIERHSLSELMPHLAYDKERALYILNDGYVGYGFVSMPLSGVDDTVTQRLNAFLTFDYPEGTFIQVMMLASPDIRKRMEAMLGMRDVEGSKSLKKSAENRIRLFVGATENAISHNLPAYVRDFKVIISVKIPQVNPDGIPTEKDIEMASDLRLKTGESLKSAGLGVENLTPETLLRTIGTLLHWGQNANWKHPGSVYDDSLPINEQIPESDDMVEVDQNGVWLGHKRLRMLSPGRLPDTMDMWNMRRMIGDPMTGMRGINGNFFINLNIFIPDNAMERSALDRKRNAITPKHSARCPISSPRFFTKSRAPTSSMRP